MASKHLNKKNRTYRPHEEEGYGVLHDPSSYSPLQKVDEESLILQLFCFPSLGALMTTWAIYNCFEDETSLLRRIRWDGTKDLHARIGGASLFGSDALIRKDDVDKHISVLSELSFPAFQQIPHLITIDGTRHGIARHSSEVWWDTVSDEWKTVEAWFYDALQLFDSVLSMSTEERGHKTARLFQDESEL